MQLEKKKTIQGEYDRTSSSSVSDQRRPDAKRENLTGSTEPCFSSVQGQPSFIEPFHSQGPLGATDGGLCIVLHSHHPMQPVSTLSLYEVEQRLLHITRGINPQITRDPHVILVPCEKGLRCAKVIQKIDK